MCDLIGLGIACLDMIWLLDEYPAEDTKNQAGDLLIQGGGPAATALVAAARLGLSAAYFGAVGDDPAGRAILDGLREEGVDTSLAVVRAGGISHTATALVNRNNGKRTVIWHPGTASPPDPALLPDDRLGRVRFLHLDGHHPRTALPLARRARALGVRVSLDAGSNYPWMAELAPLADILIGSEKFARDFTGETDPAAMVAKLAQAGPGIAGVTLGDRGGMLGCGREVFAYPGFAVRAVDTNGAGDVFHGAFLAALAAGSGPREAAIFASAAAALKCTAPGGRTGIPTRAEVEGFLQERQPLLRLRP